MPRISQGILSKHRLDQFSIIIKNYAIVTIVDNVAYKVLLHENVADKSGILKCPLQAYEVKPFEDLDSINCTFMVLNNTEMTSKYLPGYDQLHSYINDNCMWYTKGSINEKLNASIVYHKILQYNTEFIGKCSERFVPLSVCPCSQNGSYNCYDANLGSVFPGQMLHTKFIIPYQWPTSSLTIIGANTKDDDCSIVDSYQLSQSHPIMPAITTVTPFGLIAYI